MIRVRLFRTLLEMYTAEGGNAAWDGYTTGFFAGSGRSRLGDAAVQGSDWDTFPPYEEAYSVWETPVLAFARDALVEVASRPRPEGAVRLEGPVQLTCPWNPAVQWPYFRVEGFQLTDLLLIIYRRAVLRGCKMAWNFEEVLWARPEWIEAELVLAILWEQSPEP